MFRKGLRYVPCTRKFKFFTELYISIKVFRFFFFAVTIVFCVLLYLVDAARGSGLNLSAKDRKRLRETKEIGKDK